MDKFLFQALGEDIRYQSKNIREKKYCLNFAWNNIPSFSSSRVRWPSRYNQKDKLVNQLLVLLYWTGFELPRSHALLAYNMPEKCNQWSPELFYNLLCPDLDCNSTVVYYRFVSFYCGISRFAENPD